MLAFLRAELDVAEASPVEMRTQERGDLHRVLVGNQAKVDLPARFGGDDRLRSRPVVAGLDAAHVARWLEHGRPLGFVVRAPKGEAFDADDLTCGPRVEGIRSSIARSASVGFRTSS